MAGEIRALTIRQPWASAITFGDKRVENRTKPTTYRGLLAIHAGLTVDWDAAEKAWPAAGLAPYVFGAPRSAWTASLPLGAVIAVAELAGCHDDGAATCLKPHGRRGGLVMCSPWARGFSWHWELGAVRPLGTPVPCKGALGLWRLPEDVEKAVRAQLSEDGDHSS
jgi:hypothetical protein